MLTKQERYRRKLGQQPRYLADDDITLKTPRHRRLTAKQQQYAEYLSQGMNQFEASKKAGYTSRSSSTAALKNPLLQRYLSSIRSESRAIAAYNLVTAMEEALADHRFAVEKGNAMAAVKATELRAKLSGLLVDKVEVISVDLTKALAMAESRVFHLPALKQTPEANAQA